MLAASKYGLEVAVLAITVMVFGFLNVFALVRAVFAAVKRQTVSRKQKFLAACALLGSVALVLVGHWLPLVLVTAGLLFVDAVVLRFK